MNDTDWHPTADHAALTGRARMLGTVREFFAGRGVLEVETPVMSAAASSDPRLASFATGHAGGVPMFLQTSPEYAMKRLLAAGSGDIYQVCKAFRGGERSRLHNPEFTMLEWYRAGFGMQEMMREAAALLGRLLAPRFEFTDGAAFVSYQELFSAHAGADPLRADADALADLLVRRGVPVPGGEPERDELLDLAMVTLVLPALPPDALTFIHSYPATQAALAMTDPADERVALRFEAVLNGIELCNGFQELRDAQEQSRRFREDRDHRARSGLPDVAPDPRLLGALRAGLPPCSGVAIGLDRVLMLSLGREHIDEVLAFPVERA